MKKRASYRHAQPYAQRRERLAAELKEGVVLLPNAPEAIRSNDTHYLYRWNSDFYYLSGFKEPESLLALVLSGGRIVEQVLFCREKDPAMEIWEGFRFGPKAAARQFGFDSAYPITSLAERLPELIKGHAVIHTPIGLYRDWDQLVTNALATARSQVRQGVRAPDVLADVRTPIAVMRLVKDPGELTLMRQSAAIASAAHVRAMGSARPGQMEYEVEAEILYAFKKNGAYEPAYASIVAAGANACILHYSANNQRIGKNDLLLIDAGCEYEGYASDITRTFPVNGRFSGAQKELYELVLAAQLAAIAAVKPGEQYIKYHDVAVKTMVEGFKSLKLCKGSVDKIIANGDYKQFYMHKTGHWLGQDVHDAGRYQHLGQWPLLAAGNVVTVEPGCYIRPADNVPKAFWNIGIRIEDDVLVTANGPEVLTAACPKTISAVEAACER